MKTWEFLIMGIGIGLPSIVIQLWFYRKERQRVKKSLLFTAWSELQSELAKALHEPHVEAQELDGLLEKLETFTAAGISTISIKDRERLTELLRQKVDNEKHDKRERTRAEFLLFAMPRAEQERQTSKKVLPK